MSWDKTQWGDWAVGPGTPPGGEPMTLLPPPKSAAAGMHFARTIAIVLAPFLVGVLAALFLAVPDQTREIYRVFARDYAFRAPLPKLESWSTVFAFVWQRLALSPIDLSWVGIAAAGVLNWQLARNLTLEFARDELAGDDVRGKTLRWLPRICGALIPIGAGTGLLLAAAEVRELPFDFTSLPTGGREYDAGRTLFFAGVVFYVTALALVIYGWLRTRNKRYKYKEANRWLFSGPVVGLVVLATLALIVLFATPITGAVGVQAAWWLRTPILFCLFVMLLAYYATGMSVATWRLGIPVIPLLAFAVFLIAVFDFNDNHAVEVMPSKLAIERPTTRQAFLKWYAARADRTHYERAGKPYPVFLVTAAGGGLYAADFAATALARMQDTCAAFAQHVFAVSGVSGGGLGAAMFSGLVEGTRQVSTDEIKGADPCAVARPMANNVTYETRIAGLVQQDYLAPTAASGLFPDFFQRFLPFPINALDRSRAFETTLDLIWQRTNLDCKDAACAPFTRPFLASWTAEGTAPALVLNATNVDVGYRTVIAPFAIANDVPGEYSALEDFHNSLAIGGPNPRGVDVTLATAVGLSARFPWIMPAATVRAPGNERSLRLLDGGIFENSGVDTLTDMLIDLRGLETPPAKRMPADRDQPWIIFHPIVISGFELSSGTPSGGLRGEALSPVSAMLAARVQRAGMSSYRLFLDRGYNCGKPDQSAKCEPSGLRFLVLNHVDYRLPLGWQLSDFTRNVVASHVGTAHQCDPIPRIRSMFTGGRSPQLRYQRQQFTTRENDCTACSVLQALRGEPLSGSSLCRKPG